MLEIVEGFSSVILLWAALALPKKSRVGLHGVGLLGEKPGIFGFLAVMTVADTGIDQDHRKRDGKEPGQKPFKGIKKRFHTPRITDRLKPRGNCSLSSYLFLTKVRPFSGWI